MDKINGTREKQLLVIDNNKLQIYRTRLFSIFSHYGKLAIGEMADLKGSLAPRTYESLKR